MENLGRVIDKENNIFCQKGVTYQYVLGEGRREVPPSALPSEPVVPETEKLILDFGDAWFLQEYLSKQPFYNSIQNTLPEESDTLLALIFYRLLTNKGAGCHAKIWYEGNYSYLAFPHANLTSQNISRILKELGREEIQRHFFEEYMFSIYGCDGAAGTLVDSTGVPNATKMDITQISNPILDAGYFSEKNAAELFESGIPFMTRLAPNKTVFKDAAVGNLDDLMSQKYVHRYGERLVFIKKVPVNVCGHEAYVYLCIDEDMYLMQHKKTILNALDDKKDFNETDAAIKRLGAFAILASEEISEDKLLPMYYTRQQAEHVFDISKNYADLLPIRVQSEQAFAGHLLVCFMATAIMQKLQQELLKRRSRKAKSLNAESIFCYLRNQKCKVYRDYAIPQEPCKELPV